MSSTYTNTTERRLYRDADRAVLGGVCAGLADYFGLNLKVTRFLAVIAFLTALPFAVISYLAAVCLIPAASYRGRKVRVESRCCWTRSRRRSRRSRRTRERIDREFEAFRKRLRDACERNQCHFVTVRTDHPIDEVLTNYLAFRKATSS